MGLCTSTPKRQKIAAFLLDIWNGRQLSLHFFLHLVWSLFRAQQHESLISNMLTYACCITSIFSWRKHTHSLSVTHLWLIPPISVSVSSYMHLKLQCIHTLSVYFLCHFLLSCMHARARLIFFWVTPLSSTFCVTKCSMSNLIHMHVKVC